MSEAPRRDEELAEIERDTRRERRLVWQALIAAVVVGAVVLLRELSLLWT